MKDHPNYYSILPAAVRYSKSLTDFQKILFSEITALANKDGYCSASNGYFAELYDKEPENISRHISRLEAEGFVIRFVVKDESGRIVSRHLFPSDQQGIVEKYKGGTVKNVNRGTVNSDKGGTVKNVKENNTSINTTRENKESAPAQTFPDQSIKQRDIKGTISNPDAYKTAINTFKHLAAARRAEYPEKYISPYFLHQQQQGRWHDIAPPVDEGDALTWFGKHYAGLQAWALRQPQFEKATSQEPGSGGKVGLKR